MKNYKCLNLNVFLISKCKKLLKRYPIFFIKRFLLNGISHLIFGGCVSRRIPIFADVVEAAQEFKVRVRQGIGYVRQIRIFL